MAPSRLTGLTLWLVASIFLAYQYLLRVMPNVMLNDIINQFQINSTAFGQFSGIYYIGYSLMHLPVGIMLDRFGPRKVMTSCILLTVIGLTPLLFAEHWIYPIMGRALIGMGSSAAILGLFKIVRMTFAEERFSRMLSLSVTIGLLGAIYGGGPVSYMCEQLGYQTVIQLFALTGICLACITYYIIPEIKAVSSNSIGSDIKKVISNRKVISTCLCAGLMVGPIEGFADVWGTTFLKQAYKFDNTMAASLPSMIFIGMCLGGPMLSLIAEKVNNYLGTIVFAGIAMAVSFSYLLIGHLSYEAISFNFLIIGFCSAYQILAIYKASTYVSEDVAGLTTALANMIIMIFGYAFHTAIGAIIHANEGAGLTESLKYGISVIPLGLIFGTAGFILLFIREKKKASREYYEQISS